MMFPIHRVDREKAEQFEQLGTKPKFWFRDGQRRLLFKAEARGTGEDWAEVVASCLCELIGLPHVEYELAAEYRGGQLSCRGVICENMAQKPRNLVLGNQLLLAFSAGYPSDEGYKVKQHTVDAVCEVLSWVNKPSAEWTTYLPDGISTALEVFVGYVLLDAWIANPDRHHENWGVLQDSSQDRGLTLAPTFDQGAGFARNLLDSERLERMTTRDKNRSTPAFAAKGRSAFFGSITDGKPLLLMGAFRLFSKKSPRAATIWRERLRAVSEAEVSSILHSVPADRMSDVCRQFTQELLKINRQRLLELEFGK